MTRKPIYFDHTIEMFRKLPDLRKMGFPRATLITSWGLYETVRGDYDTSRIDTETCRRTATEPTWWNERQADMIVLDEEHLDMHSDDLCRRDITHDQCIEAIRIYRAAHPGVAIGYYAKLPEASFYAPLIHAMPTSGWGPRQVYLDWVEHNTQFSGNVNNGTLKLHNRGLLSQVDRIFPSMYQHWKDATNVDPLEVWKHFHDGTIAECEQYQKPIMPYLSPRFAGSAEYFAPGVWREMLRHSLAHPSVDGVVIYQGTSEETDWDEYAIWWKETLEVHNGNS